MAPTYSTVCPRCERPLQVVARGPEIAPWECPGCLLSFFAAELTEAARSVYRPKFLDFGRMGPAPIIHTAVLLELEAAHVRGTSLREDQLRGAHTDVLQLVAKEEGVHADMVALIGTELVGRSA